MNTSRIPLVALCAAFSIACGESDALGPPFVAAEPNTQAPRPAPPPGLTALEIEGVYDLTARVMYFDPAWGDLTDYRYEGVLTLEYDARYEPGIGGTFADLLGVLPTGERDSWEHSGKITSHFHDGEVVIELVGESFTFTLIPTGVLGGSGHGQVATLEGYFGAGGHIGGPFALELHP